MSAKMKCLSTFSGDGGFDIALESTGEIETIAFIEKDDHCQMVLHHHWPNVPIFSDIKEVTVAKIKKQFGKIDIIVGGFPCQDVSVAGNRKGLAGARSGLWFEFLRLIKGLHPEWVIIENVPGLLSSNEGRDFEVILRGLVECGYGCAWRILDAKYFGVPQRRRRVFIVGHLGTGRAAEVLFEREGVLGNIAACSEPGQELAGTLKGGSGERGYPDPSDGNGGGLTLDRSNERIESSTRHSKPRDGRGHQRLYAIDSINGNSMKSKNPNSGFHEEDAALTLTTFNDPSDIRGGNVIVEPDGSPSTAPSPFWDGADTGGDAVVEPEIFNQRGGYGISEEDNISPALQSEGGTHQGGPSRMPLVVTNDSRAQSNDDGNALPLTQSDTGSGRQAVVVGGTTTPEISEDVALPVVADQGSGSRQAVVINNDSKAGTADDDTSFPLRSAGGAPGQQVVVLHENKEGNLAEADTARALRAGASHSCQAVLESVDNVPLVEAVDARNMVVDGDVTATLQAKDKGYSLNYSPLALESQPVAFQSDGSGQDAQEDGTTPTLLSGGDPDKVEHHGAYRKMALAFQVVDRAHSMDANLAETAHTLQAHPQSESSNIQNGVLAFMGGQGAKAGSVAASESESPTLKGAPSGTNQVPTVMARSTIRKFTPTETERLQGFPDSWTAIIGNKKRRLKQDQLEYYRRQLETNYGREITDEEVHRIVSDSHRYRQMGNAVAVPVVAWIARRLVKVHNSPPSELKAEDLLPAFLTGGQMSLWE